MRPLWPSFAFLLLREAESTTLGGTPITAATLNLSTLSPREEMTAAVKPMSVQLQDEGVDEADNKQEGKEERTIVRPPSSNLVTAVHRTQWNEWLTIPHVLPTDSFKLVKICEETNIVTEKQLEQWLIKFQMPDQSFRGDDLVTGLIQGGRGEELVQLLHQMWGIPELKKRAAMMQRALLAEEPKLLPSVFDMWLGSKVTPAEAYHMMPISAEKISTSAVSDILSWSVIFPKLRHWLDYVFEYRLKWPDFSVDQVIDLLVDVGRSEVQLVNFFHWLRKRPRMKDLADELQKMHALRLLYPAKTLNQMFDLWRLSEVDPKEVYYMMPISSQKMRAVGDQRGRFASCSKLKLWIDYVFECRSKGRDFNDDQVIELLVNSLPEVEVVEFFHWLRYQPEMNKRADLLQKKLALMSSDLKETLLLMNRVWLTSNVRPDEVFHMMPISSETSLLGTVGGKPSSPVAFRNHIDWIRYVFEYRKKGNVFSDDQVMAINLQAEEAVEKLRLLGEVSAS